MRLLSIQVNSIKKRKAIINTAKQENRRFSYDTFYSLDNNGNVLKYFVIWYYPKTP